MKLLKQGGRGVGSKERVSTLKRGVERLIAASIGTPGAQEERRNGRKVGRSEARKETYTGKTGGAGGVAGEDVRDLRGEGGASELAGLAGEREAERREERNGGNDAPNNLDILLPSLSSMH